MRKILFFDYPGDKQSNNLINTHHIIERYKEFFESGFGGCWNAKSEFIDLNENGHRFTNITDFALEFGSALRTLNQCDFSIIMFVGHGCAYNGIDRIQVLPPSQNIEDYTIPVSCLYKDIEGGKGKRLILIDSCRSTPRILSCTEYLNESKEYDWLKEHFGNSSNNRDYYNQLFAEAPNHIELIQSTQRGEEAYTITQEESSVFTKSLFSVIKQKLKTVRFVQLSGNDYHITYNNILKDVNTDMSKKNYKSQQSQLTVIPPETNTHFPLIALDGNATI